MNLRYVLKQLGLLLLVLSAVLVGVAAVFFLAEAGLKHDVTRTAMQAMFITGLIGILAGGGAWLFTRKTEQQIGRRAALLLVAVSWLGGAAFAGLPFFLWAHLPGTDAPDGHPFRSFVNCYFEAMSGLTTTGATILAGDPATGWDIESVPRSLLLWRAFTQWLGGLGIVVLFVAVLPSLGVGGKRLFQVEAPGPAPEGLQPQIRQTARVLLTSTWRSPALRSSPCGRRGCRFLTRCATRSPRWPPAASAPATRAPAPSTASPSTSSSSSSWSWRA
jgi:trk system potassium uptake protein TrkH